MPFNISRSSQFFDKEVLKYPQAGLLTKSIVIDATNVAQNADREKRTVVPAGTILKLSATNTTQYVEYNGTGSIAGILARPIDLLAQATGASEPANIFWHEAVFATTQIVGFTQYASALVSTLNTCKFE